MKRPKETDFISNDVYDLDSYAKAMANYATYLEEQLAKYETLKAAFKAFKL